MNIVKGKFKYIKMVFFFKLEDGIKKDEISLDAGWIETIGRLITYIQPNCHNRRVSMLVFKIDEEIQQFTIHNEYKTDLRVVSRNQRQYYPNERVVTYEEAKMVKTFNMEDVEEKQVLGFRDHYIKDDTKETIEDILDEYTFNPERIYIHFTCETNVENIIKMGFLPESRIPSEMRLGNILDDDWQILEP